jgi:hypothetical protein
MKKLSLLFLIPLIAFKTIPVNPAYPGTYKFYDEEKKQATIWIVSQNPKSVGKIDFRRPTDVEPLFTAQMTDATHFKTKHDFTEHLGNTDVNRSCSGYFADGEMTLLIGYETITFGIRKNLVRKLVNEHRFKKMK